jgi:parvulin-like peptidyl-prolyl isomerase
VATPAPIPRNKPVALVAGQPISGAAYADLVARERVAAAAQAQQQGGSAPDERQIRTQALTDMITTAVINHYARQRGITAAARAVQQRYDATRTQIEQQARQAGQSVTFTAVLKQYGYTIASFKQDIANAIVGSKVEQKIAPPGLIDAVRVRHILIGPPLTQSGAGTPTPKAKAKPDSYYKADAETVAQQLKHDPSRFAALARQKSVDTASGAQGGELGWVVKGMTVPAFEKTAFSLPVGQISPPVKSQYGYHIIQVEAHRKVPFTALPQSALQVPAVQALAQRQQNRFQNWLAAERKRDHVRILYKV